MEKMEKFPQFASVPTLLGNSCFHLLHCVVQTFRYVMRYVMQLVWMRGKLCRHVPGQ